jgi:ribosomal protein L19E
VVIKTKPPEENSGIRFRALQDDQEEGKRKPRKKGSLKTSQEANYREAV